MTTETQYEWVREACSSWEGNDPAELLEHLMAQGECPAFGPVHHVPGRCGVAGVRADG